MIIILILSALLTLLGVLLLCGKGAFLISGYNTMSKAQKELYDEKALCSFVGKFILFLAACIALFTTGNPFLHSTGIAFLLISTIIAIAYIGDMSRFLKDDLTPNQLLLLEKDHKWRNTSKAVAIGITSVILVLCAGLIVYSEQEPTITINHDTLHISGLYGRSFSLNSITNVTLLDDSMANIGMGFRRSGYSGFSDVRKGRFDAGLLFVSSNQSPTLLIEYADRPNPNIFISLRDPESTKQLYIKLLDSIQ